MTNGTYLITGALGCIGSWVVRELAGQGLNVVAADRGVNRDRFELVTSGADLSSVRFESLDITYLDAVRAVIDRYEVTNIIHLAALQVPFCRADPPLGAAVNVVGTVNIFEAVKEFCDQVNNVVYAGSVGMFDISDADPRTMTLAVDAVAHPRSHYGVYKQANEGTASVYWDENGVPSIGLRPFVVYGPGRDQGLTSSPTMALLAAALRCPYKISYGGRVQMQFAPDAAGAFIAASRHIGEGALTANLGGPIVTIADLVACVETSDPEVAGLITYAEDPLPFPESVDSSALGEILGALPQTNIQDGVARTLRHFGDALRHGRVPQALISRILSAGS